MNHNLSRVISAAKSVQAQQKLCEGMVKKAAKALLPALTEAFRPTDTTLGAMADMMEGYAVMWEGTVAVVQGVVEAAPAVVAAFKAASDARGALTVEELTGSHLHIVKDEDEAAE